MKGAINVMKKKNLFKRVFTILLSAMILLSMLPVSVFANNDNTNEVASKIVREVTELREESVKHFLCEDGSYIAVSYAEPVHYEENGEWKEIDNTLVLSSKNTYVPKSNDLEVSIPQSFSGGGKITATNKGHTINFGVNPGNKNVVFSKTASVKEVEELSSTAALEKNSNILKKAKATTQKADGISEIERYNSTKTVVDNQAGALLYDKIFPNADLEYIVNGNSIKENIVVHQKQEEYVYTFDMDFGGLIPVEQEDGSYRIIDSAKPDETVFVLAAPYMYDANGTESYEVEMSLAANGNKYLLTLLADATWINNSQRAFPVVIDPTVYYDFDDVFVMDGVFNQNTTKIGNELRVGRNLANLTRTYIKISEPQKIALGSHITDAKLTLSVDYYFQAIDEEEIEIYIYDCYNLPNWTATSVTWNNQPFGNTDNSHNNYSSDRLDSLNAAEDKDVYNFNITEAVRRWLMTGVNKGFMLASSNETSKIQLDFHSSRSDVGEPLIQVNYIPPNLSISKWETGKNAATSPNVEITTTETWTISVDAPWISVSTTSGTGNATFTISTTENTSVEQREGKVSVMMGQVEIGEIEVKQSGENAYLFLDEESFLFDYKVDSNNSKTVAVNTNATSWEVTDDADWLSAEKSSIDTNKIIITAIQENTTDSTKTARVTVTAHGSLGDVLKTIEIIQYDKVTCLFNTINEDGTLSAKSSSEYNHELATWAMELSYAAYNYPDGTDLPTIPGAFMGDVDYTAADVLSELGFGNITEHNYTLADCSAHTIAYREIKYVKQAENISEEEMVSNDNIGVYQSNPSIPIYAGIHSMASDTGSISGNLPLEDVEQINNIRPLVVVAVRGSVTMTDWFNNFRTQLTPWDNKFVEMKNDLAQNLTNYVSQLNDPIILLTGHSLGAAVANLLAAELSSTMGVENVYAYTFATPQVVTESLGYEAIPYSNIFNILNTNDVVTYMPTTLLVPLADFWSRHGVDISLNMPYSESMPTELVGVFCHSMDVYMTWMENNEGITESEIMAESAQARTRGLLPWIVRIKCPVGVTLRDSEGNIVAYESQQNGVAYPAITDTGIVSWIDDDGAKVFFVPHYANTEKIEIEAYDYGNMTMSIGVLDTDEAIDSKTYNNVNLFPERSFEVDISETFEDFSEDIKLIEVDENGDSIGEITDLSPHLRSVSVDDPVVAYGTVSTFTIVTTKDATKIQFIYQSSGDTMTLTRDDSRVISLVEDGDNLIWTVQKVFPGGEHIFDFGVKIDKTWYITENVIALNVY